VLDAVNEAPQLGQVLREALELVSAARDHAWVQVVLSAQDEFLLVWRGRRVADGGNPFRPVRGPLVKSPQDFARPAALDEPPARFVSDMAETEPEKVYGRYQRERAAGQSVPACRTPWDRLPPLAPGQRRPVPAGH
jgi:hypothetical protein